MSPPHRGIGFDSKIFERAEAEVAHPARLFLHLGNLRDDLGVQPAAARKTSCDGVMKSYLLISPTEEFSSKSVAMVD
jgi:hypothetical protein